jgi:uncharacterized Tic20 family protein
VSEASTPPDAKARNWASISHLSALAVVSGAPFGNVLGPLFVYLIRKDDDPFIAFAARESLNFQIFVSICGFFLFVAYIGSFVSAFFSTFYDSASRAHPPILALAILPFFFILAIFDLVNVIIAAVRTNKGEAYRYPITLRFVR